MGKSLKAVTPHLRSIVPNVQRRMAYFAYRLVDINDMSLFDVLHPSRVSKPDDPIFGDFGVQQVSSLLDIYRKGIEKGGKALSYVAFGLNFGPVRGQQDAGVRA